MKRILLGIAVAFSFLVGYAGSAQAWPGVPDRSEHQGYFRAQFDNWGGEVWPGGVWAGVNSADSFISDVLTKMNTGTPQQRIGAVFIIQTMIGLSRSNPPTAAQISDWAARVRQAQAQGRVSWNIRMNYTVNSFFQGVGSGNNPFDDAFYYESGTSNTIVFRNAAGAVIYGIRRECANPVGNLTPLPTAADFTMAGNSDVNDNTVTPGQTVQFRHFVRNLGPTAAPAVRWFTYNTITGAQIATGGPNAYNSGQQLQVNTENFTVPLGAPPGTQYCRQVAWNPATEAGGGNRGAQVCVTVQADYNLTPSVTASASVAQPSDTITFTYNVAHSGTNPSPSVSCKIIKTTPGPGYTPLPQQDVDRNPDGGGHGCPRVFSPGPVTVLTTENVNVGNVPAGSYVCRSLVVNPKDGNGGPRSSAETCVLVAKSPHVHFLGGDVWAGGGFVRPDGTCGLNTAKIQGTSRPLPSGALAGAYGEYGVFALNNIVNFGSAATPLTTTTGRTMTFANSITNGPNQNKLGYFGAPAHCITDFVTPYSSLPAIAPGTFNLAASNYNHRVNGNATINATGQLPAGRKVVLYVTGDVTINGPGISYRPGPYTNTQDIPSVVIVAGGRVTVADSVTQLDGVYVSKGDFTTCNQAGNLTINLCNQQLRINGAVLAERIILRRTFGGSGATDPERKEPAERFNLTPYTYLSGLSQATQNVQIRTMIQRDLPPRF